MHEAEQMYETLKNAEKLYEELQQENLKLVDHEDEASEEDLKEDLDRADLLEQAVELEQKLVQQGKSQEEIDTRVEESIEATEFEEKLEQIIEEQEQEKLKLVDHEDEASEEDLKEDLDRADLLEQAVELEEKLVQQGESQEKIDVRVEKAIEEALEEKEVETYENVEDKEIEVLKPELDVIESESEDNKDLLEEDTKLGSEESDEEETECLRELYRQETGRSPIYARKKTKGYSQWLEQRELGAEKIKKFKSERKKIKEIKEEDWKATLKEWIKEASEEVCNAEFKSELKKVLERKEFEDLIRKYYELDEKSQYEKLSEKEKNRLKSLRERVQKLDPIQLKLLLSVFFIKKYITWKYKDDFWDSPRVNRALSEFFKHSSQQYQELKKAQENKENSKEIIRNWIKQVFEGKISPELKEKLKEIVENKENLEELKIELDAIESESEDKKDFLEEITKLINEKLDEVESERLQELYRQETGRSPIYARKKTKGYSQWLEQRELGAEKIKKFKNERKKIKEIKEEDWKATLKEWIKEASEEVCNTELKFELKRALENYNKFRYLTRKFLELYEKSQYEKLSEKEKNRIKSLIEKLQEPGAIQLELLVNIRAFKDYFNNQYWYDFWNKTLVNRVRSKFFKHISQKYKELRKEQQFYFENLQESIKKLPITMNYYNRLKCSGKYSNNNFKTIVFSCYRLYSLQINSSNWIKKLGFKLEESCEELFFHYFNQILQNYKAKNIYTNLPTSKRSPHLIAAAIIYIILETHFDVVFTKKEYSNILSINYEKFTDCVNYCIKNYFIIDDSVYYNKILHYYHILIEKLNKDYKLNLSEKVRQTVIKEGVKEFYFSLKNNIIYIPEDILQKLYSSERNIYAILSSHGLDINILFKELKYNYFMPQYMALALIYFCKDFEPIKSKKRLNYIELSKLTNYSSKKIRSLVTLLRFNIENMENHRYYHTKYYSKEHFVNDLEELYKKTERSDILFLLKTFKILRLTPNEFAQNVVSYMTKKGESCSPRTLISILRKKVSSIGNKTYYKMEKNVKALYHQKKISSVELHKALRLIQRAENIKSRVLFHNSVKYSFKFNRINLRKIRAPIIRSRLANHFLKINESKYPKQLFDDESVTKGSMFYLRGTNKEKLSPNEIIKLIKQLNIEQKMGIQKTGFLQSFSECVNKSYISHLDKFGVIPNHHPILNSLIKKKK